MTTTLPHIPPDVLRQLELCNACPEAERITLELLAVRRQLQRDPHDLTPMLRIQPLVRRRAALIAVWDKQRAIA